MHKYFGLSAIALLLAFCSSCSVISGLQSKKDGSVRKATVLPRDREQIQQQASLKTFTPSELAKGLLFGDWAIEEVNGKKATGESAPFIKFEKSQNRIYGNNGCNTINASYKYNPSDSTLQFSDLISTMMDCGMSGITDFEINTALQHTRRYSWNLGDNAYFLYFFSEDGQPLMTLMHQNFEFLNGTWLVVSIDDEPVDVPDMKMVFDVDEHKIHGNTGCNVLNGSFETDMDSPNSISFQELMLTRMACEEPNYETRLLVALEAASYAKPIEADKVLFLDDRSKVVLTLIRTSDN